MNVALAFIFRPEGLREAIFKQIIPIVTSMYPFNSVTVHDSLHNPFNRAASRNEAIRDNMSADVVVICDADSIPVKDSLIQAIEGAYAEQNLHIPFDLVKVISAGRFIARPLKYSKQRAQFSYGPSCGGIYVVPPKKWIEVGGMDERVTGHGFEDRILLTALKTHGIPPVFHPGTLFNVNHARDISSWGDLENNALMDSYLAAELNLPEFRKVQHGSSQWGGMETD